MVLYKEDFLKQWMFIFGSFCHLTIFLLQLPSTKLVSVSSSHLLNERCASVLGPVYIFGPSPNTV